MQDNPAFEPPVGDDAILDRIRSLPQGDSAVIRTNPFAVSRGFGLLVTADEVRVSYSGAFPQGFACPKCRGAMRHFIKSNGTAYFAHALSRRNCSAGRETPAHICIKRGLHSVGFECEVLDEDSGMRWDAFHKESGVIVEVVCSGHSRYRPKIDYIRKSGKKCWWLLDSAGAGICSAWGSERICLESLGQGHVVVAGLFKPVIASFLESAGDPSLFTFWLGLVWRCVGGDRWELLAEEHPLSIAATAEDGMKHLMVKMHAQNGFTVTENKRRGISGKTWFDMRFRYRGNFTTTWGGDRQYVTELIAQLAVDLDSIANQRKARLASVSCGSPSEPIHKSADEILDGLSRRHAVSLQEISELRRIAEDSKITAPLNAQKISGSQASPFVLNESERRDVAFRRQMSFRFVEPLASVSKGAVQ